MRAARTKCPTASCRGDGGGVESSKVFKYLALEPELHRKRGRAAAFVVAVVAVLVLLFGLLPFKMYIEAQGVLKPQNQELVHARVGGFAAEVRVKDGQWVKKDDVLLVLSDPELEGRIKERLYELRRRDSEAERSNKQDGQ
jgi:multidrug efflux pump subunit AcrA (membrane-fusion protein)